MIFIKLEPNDDLLESITLAAKEYSIKTGFFTAIGAINQANVGYYLIDQKKYKILTFNGDFEVVSCLGNVTLKNNSPIIHAHLMITDKNGNAIGGHLLPGCRISVTGEVFMLEGKNQLIRKIDEQFGLSLINLD